uniref:Uncharacterized protein n=1 Tax=Rhizophora mucronata TaxID=61149 RepID=A0A2P2PS20_RHIMU
MKQKRKNSKNKIVLYSEDQ